MFITTCQKNYRSVSVCTMHEERGDFYTVFYFEPPALSAGHSLLLSTPCVLQLLLMLFSSHTTGVECRTVHTFLSWICSNCIVSPKTSAYILLNGLFLVSNELFEKGELFGTRCSYWIFTKETSSPFLGLHFDRSDNLTEILHMPRNKPSGHMEERRCWSRGPCILCTSSLPAVCGSSPALMLPHLLSLPCPVFQ